MKEQSSYPLCWPEGWQRTPAARRERGCFDGTPDKVRRQLVLEIDRIALGQQSRTHTIRNYVVISTNMPLRADGEPMAVRAAPQDPGVAVYFKRKEQQVCFACDKYDQVWKNMRAIQKTIEALRGIERWGSSTLLDRAFTGFTALPEKTGPTCFEILGISPEASEAAILEAYRTKAKQAHPDHGGSVEAFQSVVAAKDNALAVLKGRQT